MVEWIREHFPNSEIVPLAKMCGPISEANECIILEGEGCRILKTTANTGMVIKSSQDVFFDTCLDGSFSPMSAQLKNLDVLFDKDGLRDPILYITDSEELPTFSRCNMSIIRMKNEASAAFLVWYLSLDFVKNQIADLVEGLNRSWKIETLPIPVADYLIEGLFQTAIHEIAMAENRISRNSNEMLSNLKTIREDILLEVGEC